MPLSMQLCVRERLSLSRCKCVFFFLFCSVGRDECGGHFDALRLIHQSAPGRPTWVTEGLLPAARRSAPAGGFIGNLGVLITVTLTPLRFSWHYLWMAEFSKKGT